MTPSRWFIVLTLFLLTISGISALCSSGQIDINTASVEELDKITHVGPAIGQLIIDGRSFASIDELVDVKGISEGYVLDIKSQNLACVADENSESEEENEEVAGNETNPEEISVAIEETQPKIVELQAIDLSQNSKAIKSEENSEVESDEKDNYAIYGLIGFSILIIVLFALNKKKEKRNGLA